MAICNGNAADAKLNRCDTCFRERNRSEAQPLQSSIAVMCHVLIQGVHRLLTSMVNGARLSAATS